MRTSPALVAVGLGLGIASLVSAGTPPATGAAVVSESLPAASGALPTPEAVPSNRPQRVAARWSVGLRLDRAAVDVGYSVAMRGRVSPAARGTLVLIQKRQQGTSVWKTDARLRTRPNGEWRHEDRPTTPGTRFYRAVVPATDGHRRGSSATRGLEIYRPRPLSGLPVIQQEATGFGVVTIGGVTYEDAVVGVAGATSGVVWWRTDDCRRIRFSMGNGAGSGDALAKTDALRDGQYYYRETHASGSRGPTHLLPLSDRSTFRFAWSSEQLGGAETARAALVDGVAWCAY